MTRVGLSNITTLSGYIQLTVEFVDARGSIKCEIIAMLNMLSL